MNAREYAARVGDLTVKSIAKQLLSGSPEPYGSWEVRASLAREGAKK